MFYIDGSASGKGDIIGPSLTTTVCTNYKSAQQMEPATLIKETCWLPPKAAPQKEEKVMTLI